MLDHDRLFALVSTLPVEDQVNLAVQVAQLVTDRHDPLDMVGGELLRFDPWRAWAARWASGEDRSAASADAVAEAVPAVPGPANIARNAALAARSLGESPTEDAADAHLQAAAAYSHQTIAESLEVVAAGDDAYVLLEQLVA